MIHKDIDQSLFEHVSTYTNVYELWTKLESLIQKKTPRNKAHLVRRLVKLEYMNIQNMIVNHLKKVDMNIFMNHSNKLLTKELLLVALLPLWLILGGDWLVQILAV